MSFETFSENLTQKELDFRDKFWSPKISQKAPSPNFLTILRIIGATFLFFFKLEPIYFFPAVIFLFLTDYFDGIIARTQDRETLFGKYADPFADKLLLVALIYYLYFQNVIFWKHIILPILIPEILLMILGVIYTFFIGILIPRPIVWGRVKFCFYFFAITGFLIGTYAIANILFIIGVVFGSISIASYTKRVFNEINLKFSLFI